MLWNMTWGGGKFAQLLYAFLLIVSFSTSHCLAQSGIETTAASQGKSQYFLANQLADRVRAGDIDAARTLAREAFKNAGIPPDVGDALGFTERIAQAEVDYRKGTRTSTHVEEVAYAFNHFASTLGTPEWTRTTPKEMRRLRVRLFLAMPHLFSCNEPPDSKGRYKLFSENLSPVEATYLAVTMLYVKTFDSSFQFTQPELTQIANQPSIRAKLHRERQALLLDIAAGRSASISVPDILTASGKLLDDLGFPERAGALSNAPRLGSNVVPAKGCF